HSLPGPLRRLARSFRDLAPRTWLASWSIPVLLGYNLYPVGDLRVRRASRALARQRACYGCADRSQRTSRSASDYDRRFDRPSRRVSSSVAGVELSLGGLSDRADRGATRPRNDCLQGPVRGIRTERHGRGATATPGTHRSVTTRKRMSRISSRK